MSTAMPPSDGDSADDAAVPSDAELSALMLDDTLSWKAKGMLAALILDDRDGIRLSTTRLIQTGQDGRESVLAGLRELERARRIVRHQQRAPDSSFGRTQIKLINPETGVPDTGVVDTGHPATGNPYPVYGATEGHTPQSQY